MRSAAIPFTSDCFPQVLAGEAKPFTLSNVTKAIAAFERSIGVLRARRMTDTVTGMRRARSQNPAKRGEILFNLERACVGASNAMGAGIFPRDPCAMRAAGNNRADFFFNTGVSDYQAPNRACLSKRCVAGGRRQVPRAEPSRNVMVTAPYMHDGSVATLEEVLDHYAAGGKMSHPNKSTILRKFSPGRRKRRRRSR